MLLEHVSYSPAKTYSFEERIRFLYLLGIQVTKDESSRTALTDEGSAGESKTQDSQTWSWLGDDSPLFSIKSESE
jgi:hypothetical protein